MSGSLNKYELLSGRFECIQLVVILSTLVTLAQEFATVFLVVSFDVLQSVISKFVHLHVNSALNEHTALSLKTSSHMGCHK